jgi:uncharacterized membrane protein
VEASDVINPHTLLALASGLLLGIAPAVAQPYAYHSIDVSCAATATVCPAGLAPGQVARQTSARGINTRGDIVGSYVDSAGLQHGFLLQDGAWITLDFPVAGVRATVANGLNAQGEIVGQYLLPINPDVAEDSPLYCPQNISANSADPACIKGFHYRNGTYSTVMFRGHPGAIAQRITSNGEIYGCLHDHDLGASMFGAAWTRVLRPDGTVEFDSAMSLEAGGMQISDAMPVTMSMNNGASRGGKTVAGLVMDMDGQQRGFIVENGTIERYTPTVDSNLTAIWDMNAVGQFVGTYRKKGELTGSRHGFIQLPNRADPTEINVTLLDAGGNAVTAFATIVFGINAEGTIVGQYSAVAGGAAHGFVAVPSRQ